MSLFKREKTLAQLIHDVFNERAGAILLDKLYQREAFIKKDYSNPTLLAAQVARLDLILELVQAAKIPQDQLAQFATMPADESDDVVIPDDGFFNQ